MTNGVMPSRPVLAFGDLSCSTLRHRRAIDSDEGVDEIGTARECLLQAGKPRRKMFIGKNRTRIPATVGCKMVVEYVEPTAFVDLEILFQVTPQPHSQDGLAFGEYVLCRPLHRAMDR